MANRLLTTARLGHEAVGKVFLTAIALQSRQSVSKLPRQVEEELKIGRRRERIVLSVVRTFVGRARRLVVSQLYS